MQARFVHLLQRVSKPNILLHREIRMKTTAIVPALNEEASIECVIEGLLHRGVHRVIVVDNGSTDNTPSVAKCAGADVVAEPRRGYGSACLAGIRSLEKTDIVVFADGDGCDDPADLPALIEPIVSGSSDLVVGSRLAGSLDDGALPLHSRFGNWLASRILRVIYRQHVSDLGPFRAIRFDALQSLHMSDPGYGWTAEMQAKAAIRGLRVVEVPVHYRKRAAGRSKITGNVSASILAGWVIIRTLLMVKIRYR